MTQLERVTRSRFVALAAAGAARPRSAASEARARRRTDHQDRLRVAADRPARAVRRGRQVGHRPDERPRFKDGLAIGGKKYGCRSSLKDSQSNPEPRRRGGERPDPEGQGRPDAGRRHARDRQPGQRRLRAERGALHLHAWCRGSRGSSAARAIRPRASTGPITSSGAWRTSSPIFTNGWKSVQTNKKVGGLFPNDGDGNAWGDKEARLPASRCGAGLHADRSGPLPERHAGLLRADRRLQDGRRRDRHRRGDPAGRQDLPDAGPAAGLQAEGRSRSARRCCSRARSRRWAISATACRPRSGGARRIRSRRR